MQTTTLPTYIATTDDRGYCKTSETFVIEDGRYGGSWPYTIGTANGGRASFRGPILPDGLVFGWCSPNCGVIDNYGGTGREIAEAKIRVSYGDPIIVEGLPGVWQILAPDAYSLDGDSPKLRPVDEAAQAAYDAALAVDRRAYH